VHRDYEIERAERNMPVSGSVRHFSKPHSGYRGTGGIASGEMVIDCVINSVFTLRYPSGVSSKWDGCWVYLSFSFSFVQSLTGKDKPLPYRIMVRSAGRPGNGQRDHEAQHAERNDGWRREID
jgi:hypothetical protein